MSYRKNRVPNSTLSRSAFLESHPSFYKRDKSKDWREASSLSLHKRDEKGDNESGYIEHRDLYNGYNLFYVGMFQSLEKYLILMIFLNFLLWPL
jgi:hypothetical protein